MPSRTTRSTAAVEASWTPRTLTRSVATSWPGCSRQRGRNLAVRHQRAVDGGPFGWVVRGPWRSVFVPRAGRGGSRRGSYALCDHQGRSERGEKGECDVHFECFLSKAKVVSVGQCLLCAVVPSPSIYTVCGYMRYECQHHKNPTPTLIQKILPTPPLKYSFPTHQTYAACLSHGG